MPTRSEAEEHLRAIRSLMEKATVYRALSAEAAFLGGLLSLGSALFLFRRGSHAPIASELFTTVWFVIFFLTVLLSLFLLRRDAARRGEVFVSAGFRSAGRAMIPPLLCGAVLSASLIYAGMVAPVPAIWMVCYGLGLLATAHFAPRSIARLGWAFVLSGLACFAAGLGTDLRFPFGLSGGRAEALQMALSFGLFHLIYAAATWPRKAALPLANET